MRFLKLAFVGALLCLGTLAIVPTVASAAACIPVETIVGADTVWSFTTVGTCEWTVPSGVTSVRALVIGGGGGGGKSTNVGGSGGGGAGAMVTHAAFNVSGTISVVVGSGGSARTTNDQGNPGQQSSLGALIAIGGGGGGDWCDTGDGGCQSTIPSPPRPQIPGANGGSGGGSGGGLSDSLGGVVAAQTLPTGAVSYGNRGGNAVSGANFHGSGGGGAGLAGADRTSASNPPTAGGIGLSSDITGTGVLYAGGGGGSGGYTNEWASGGSSIGGNGGGPNGSPAATSGVANTGSGGGGGQRSTGGAGGTGIVLVRYAAPTAPTNSAAPAISGVVRTGDTLTSSTGSWSSSPTSFAYQWKRASTSLGSYIDIGSGTNATYVVSESDVGKYIKVAVTATNSVGSSSAVLSLASSVVVDIAPVNSVVPAVSGTTRTGSTLTSSTGSWSSSPTSYAYQWKRASTSGGTYSNISSATSATYVLTDSDIDRFIKVAVTATNGIGASSAVLSLASSAVMDLTDSVVPTATAAVSTATGFTFTISNYSSDYSYAVTTSAGSVGQVTGVVTVTGLTVGEAATVTITVSRSGYKPASKTVAGSAPPATTTIAPAVVTIDIQAPVTTVAQGQAAVVTIAPTTTIALAGSLQPPPVSGSNETTTTLVVGTKPVVGPLTTTTTTTVPRLVTPTNSVVAPEIAQVATGESVLAVDGVQSIINVTRENNQLTISSGGLSAVLSGLDNQGVTRTLDADGNLRLAGGDVVKINVGGFKPGSDVDVWLFSSPTRLGTATVGADGTVSGSFVIPKEIQSGAHRIAVTAKLPNGKLATFTLGVAVGEIKKSSTSTRVLIAIPIALAVGVGLVMPTQYRRRQRRQTVA